ncbi:GWxTD domain-containing protein [Crocinitomix catalasitica]|nr:GWxTD domain-containing protein [Crocinitomix catalasitica]
MKNFLSILLIFISVSSSAKPQAYFNYKVFFTPEHESFVSTSLQFSGGTFKYETTKSGDWMANVEVTQIFSLDDSIVLVDKYEVTASFNKDDAVEDFYDVRRYSLPAGVYQYELIIKDVNSGEEITAKQSIKIEEFEASAINFSDIEFIQDAVKSDDKNNFTKNGFFILPYLTNYFPPETDKIAFYTELYNTAAILGAGEPFLLTFSLSDYDTGRSIEDIFRFQRLQAATVNPVIGFLPIENLPSGNYYLEITMINKNNDTLKTESVFFQRRNDLVVENTIDPENIQVDQNFIAQVGTDSIEYFLNSLMPISPRFEYESIRHLLKDGDTTKMKNYFYAFWRETDPMEPYAGWMRYKLQVQYAEKLFGTQIKHGFETDRGRTHLKYGSPNSVIDRPNEPSAYPYQIWHYYRIGQRSNIRYVFYNTDLVTNEYEMLHSDLPGEIQNYRWMQALHNRDGQPIQDQDPNTLHYGGNAGLLYKNP